MPPAQRPGACDKCHRVAPRCKKHSWGCFLVLLQADRGGLHYHHTAVFSRVCEHSPFGGLAMLGYAGSRRGGGIKRPTKHSELLSTSICISNAPKPSLRCLVHAKPVYDAWRAALKMFFEHITRRKITHCRNLAMSLSQVAKLGMEKKN